MASSKKVICMELTNDILADSTQNATITHQKCWLNRDFDEKAISLPFAFIPQGSLFYCPKWRASRRLNTMECQIPFCHSGGFIDMLFVEKFGGSSLAGVERVRCAARLIADTVRAGHSVAAVLSAQGKTTGRAFIYRRALQPQPLKARARHAARHRRAGQASRSWR